MCYVVCSSVMNVYFRHAAVFTTDDEGGSGFLVTCRAARFYKALFKVGFCQHLQCTEVVPRSGLAARMENRGKTTRLPIGRWIDGIRKQFFTSGC